MQRQKKQRWEQEPILVMIIYNHSSQGKIWSLGLAMNLPPRAWKFDSMIRCIDVRWHIFFIQKARTPKKISPFFLVKHQFRSLLNLVCSLLLYCLTIYRILHNSHLPRWWKTQHLSTALQRRIVTLRVALQIVLHLFLLPNSRRGMKMKAPWNQWYKSLHYFIICKSHFFHQTVYVSISVSQFLTHSPDAPLL